MSEVIDLRRIAATLLSLNGMPMVALSRRAEVHRANLYAWLGGKDHVFSEQNQLKVCEVLGWRFGGLRPDLVHRWCVGEDLSVLLSVMNLPGVGFAGAQRGVFQTDGAATDGSVALVGGTHNRPTLVVLIRRPLGKSVPPRIDAARLPGFSDGAFAHEVSGAEWRLWREEETPVSLDSYLEEFGQDFVEAAASGAFAECDPFAFPALSELEEPPEEVFEVTLNAQQRDWLSLLSQGLNAGLSYEQIKGVVLDLLESAETRK